MLLLQNLNVSAIEERGRADEVAVKGAREKLLEEPTPEQLIEALDEIALEVRLQERITCLRRTRHAPAGAAAARRCRREARRSAGETGR